MSLNGSDFSLVDSYNFEDASEPYAYFSGSDREPNNLIDRENEGNRSNSSSVGKGESFRDFDGSSDENVSLKFQEQHNGNSSENSGFGSRKSSAGENDSETEFKQSDIGKGSEEVNESIQENITGDKEVNTSNSTNGDYKENSSKSSFGYILVVVGVLSSLLILFLAYFRNRVIDLISKLHKRSRIWFFGILKVFEKISVASASFLLPNIGLGGFKFVSVVENLLNSLNDSIKSVWSIVSRYLFSSLRLGESLEKESVDKEGRRDNLDHSWHVLKEMAGCVGVDTITPSEVKRKALEEGLPEKPVSKIVKEYQKSRYSFKESSTIDLSSEIEDLEEDGGGTE